MTPSQQQRLNDIMAQALHECERDGLTITSMERTIEILLERTETKFCTTCKFFSMPRAVCTDSKGPLCNTWLSGKQDIFGCIYHDKKEDA